MEAYENYKDSGVEWIGEIPKHWRVKKLKYLIKEKLKYGANESALHENYDHPRYIRITDFGDDGKLRKDTFKSLLPEVAQDYLLQEGDILFARSGATVGKTFQFKNYEKEACFAGYLIKASPISEVISSDFLYNFTKTSYYERWKESIFNQATIQNIGADKYSTLEIVIPDRAEQVAITKYLEQKTKEIDALIQQKECLLALYAEEKTAIINQAVTKGINPDVPIKDSGIDWLGEIPESWRVVPLTKYLDSIVDYRGRTPKKLDSGMFLVTARNIKNGRIDYSLSEEYVDREDAEKLLIRGKPQIGDVLFTTEAPLGEVANVDREDIALAQRVIKFRGRKKLVNNFFLKYFLFANSFQQDLYTYATGSTALGIKASKLTNLLLLLPPLSQQERIVKHIDAEIVRIESKTEKTKRIIELQKEYRTALISEVVTGKIKVPNSEHEEATE